MIAPATGCRVRAGDGHRFCVLQVEPAQPRARLLWLPALGVAARHYLPLAQVLAAAGIAVHLHEWRGNGSSSLRPSRTQDWGYRQILVHDLAASEAAIVEAADTGPATPLIIGGHSLGGQLACLHAGRSAQPFQHLWLVATGTPDWRSFPRPRAWLLPLAYHFLDGVARLHGTLPGRRLGFGGTEARGLIHDWTRVGLRGRYAAMGMQDDLEGVLARVRAQASAVLLQQDWLAPPGSLHGLLAKMPGVRADVRVLDASTLGTPADHFAWMRRPDAVAASLCRTLDTAFSQKR